MLTLPWTGASVSETDWHWAVGIWEGEGYVGGYVDKKGCLRANISIMTTDEDMLAECVRCFDIARVYGPYRRNGKRKLAWRFSESRSRVVAEWCRMATPFIRTQRKRQQVAKALAMLVEFGEVRPYTRKGGLYGRDYLEKESEILGLTKGEQYAIGDC